MKKNIGFLVIVGIATMGLSGCMFRRVAGPCYGVGCPSFTESTQPKVAAVPNAPAANARAQSAAAEPGAAGSAAQASPAPAEAAPSDANQSKPGAFTRMLTALHLHSKS